MSGKNMRAMSGKKGVGMSAPGRPKVAKVMGEYKAGDLKSSSGQKVTNPKQAVAIALSEQRRAKTK